MNFCVSGIAIGLSEQHGPVCISEGDLTEFATIKSFFANL